MASEAYLRVIEIDKQIRADQYPNCQTLQHFFNVSERTILRDVDFMKKSFSAPLRYSKGKNGYFYTKEFKLDNLVLTEGDLVSIILGRIVLDSYKGTSYFSVLDKSFKKLSGILGDKIEVSPEGFSFATTLSKDITLDKRYASRLRTITAALEEQKLLKIVHLAHDEKQKSQKKTVKPIKLSFLYGEWFLIAIDETDKERKYAFSQITEVRKLATGFVPPENKQSGVFASNHKLQEVVVRFAPEVVDVVKEKFSSLKKTKDDRGRSAFSFQTNDVEATYRFLLSFGAQVEILKPSELRMRMRKDLLSMIAFY